jgi:hypothetical protein
VQQIRTLAYTCVNWKYQHYIPLFAHSLLYHNPDMAVEIGVDDSTFLHSRCNEYVREMYDTRFQIHRVQFHFITVNGTVYPMCPNIVRFILPPAYVQEYLFFGDVDMLTLASGITEWELQQMAKDGIPYNNEVRTTSAERLTGQHFVRRRDYFPIPAADLEELAKLKMMNYDETFLYHYTKKRLGVFPGKGNACHHGLHLSPNQPLNLGLEWKRAWMAYRGAPEFKTLELLLCPEAKAYVDKIDKFYCTEEAPL